MLNNGYPGYYVVFEGIVGAGKTTQINLLKERLSLDYPQLPVVFTREPGGTRRGEEIRDIVKNQTVPPIEEARLFVQARKHTLDEIVRPSLREGKLVICDRSFISSLAYQGFGRGLGMDKVWQLNRNTVRTTFPDCIIDLDVNQEAAVVRSGRVEPDKFDNEKREFWTKVREGYNEATRKVELANPGTLIIRVKDESGKLPKEETFSKIWETLAPAIEAWHENPEGKVLRERTAHPSKREFYR